MEILPWGVVRTSRGSLDTAGKWLSLEWPHEKFLGRLQATGNGLNGLGVEVIDLQSSKFWQDAPAGSQGDDVPLSQL